MSKAILVMDMPSSCDMCEFVDEQYHYCNIPWFGKDVSDYVACRYEDCPLRELPEEKELYLSINNEKGYCEGYNACIDEILKGEQHG